MFRLHFEQVHRITIMRTVLMGRNRASLHNEWILGIQEIAIGPTVAHKTVRFLTSISYSVFARRELSNDHLRMVFIAEWVNSV
jgi:hypothetical protein